MEILDSVQECVDRIIKRIGRDLRVATPLGIGKPNHLLNELYQRAKADESLSLTIYTALTLELPKGHSDLEKRFLEPMVERVFGNYPDLDYELDRVAERLPKNVRVIEFYFPAGKFLHNRRAQCDYISTNYTHVARDVLSRGVNVVLQQVAWGEGDNAGTVSLSCNPDVALDILEALDDRDDVVFAIQTNSELPYMFGDAVLPADEFDFVVHNRDLDYRLFGPPKMSVTDADFMIGLQASALIRDGGEIQIGIGALGDAIVYGMLMRHQNNDIYLDTLGELGIFERSADPIRDIGEQGTFEHGLFAATEMLVDGFMQLCDAGIVKRRVYDDLPLQRLLNAELIDEHITPETLLQLAEARAIHWRLSRPDFDYLTRFGVLRAGLSYDAGYIVTDGGKRLLADLGDEAAFAELCGECLGDRLLGGASIHAGFFLGPQSFYSWLRDMPEQRRREINMRSVRWINQLYGNEALDRLQRVDARFVNTGMMVTLSGAVVSDGLDDGRVVSGVGGQYNFVSMAHALPSGRSILQIRSTRGSGDDVSSNVVWNYGHITIPRHLRDVIITEYGIADLRGKTDEEVATALIQIADSRFQEDLLAQAKRVGKVDSSYEIPFECRNNRPETYSRKLDELRTRGLFPKFPFGTDLTPTEITVGAALRRLRGKMESRFHTVEALASAVAHGASHEDVLPYLQRMGLAEPEGMKEIMYQRLLAAELRKDPAVTSADSGDS